VEQELKPARGRSNVVAFFLLCADAGMENAPARGLGSGAASRKSSAPASRKSSVVVLAHNDIADIKVRKQSANILAQQLQQQLLLHQQHLRTIRRDQVRFVIAISVL